MRRHALGLLLLSAPSAAAQNEVSVSSAATSVHRPGSMNIDVIRDRRDWRMEVGYTLRWDLDDLKQFGPGTLRTLREPWELLPGDPWELADNTRLLIYGVRISPSKAFTIKRPAVPAAARTSGTVGSGARGAAPARDRRRFRLSFQPVFDDLTRNWEDDLRALALHEGFRLLPPEYGRFSDDAKRQALSDLVDYQRGQGFGAWPLDGLDYLLKRRAVPAPRTDPVRLSTGTREGLPKR